MSRAIATAGLKQPPDMNPTPTPGRMHQVDPPQGSVIYTIGIWESRIGGSTFSILPGVGVHVWHNMAISKNWGCLLCGVYIRATGFWKQMWEDSHCAESACLAA